MRNQNNFSLQEVLDSAAFTGFEGGLLAIILINLLSFSGVSVGTLGATIAILVYAQTRRIIEKIDLGIIAGLTIAIIYFFPALQGKFIFTDILIIAAINGAGVVAVTALFRLIYKILARLI